jgi:thiosulfate reductase cytochrome b subunit
LVRVNEFGKMLVVFGLVLVGVGLLLLYGSKIPWLGKLPGDITIRRENFTFYFPLATSIVVSLILTFLLWLFRR